jgi:hypothetical protein
MAFNSEQKKAYRQRPEVKAREQDYMAAWRQRPEVKAHARAYMAAWREAKREGEAKPIRRVRQSRGEQQQLDFVSDAVEKQTDV